MFAAPDLEARDLVAKPSEQILRVDAELREESSVPVGVDSLRELPICLVGLVLISALTQQLENLLLGYLHLRQVPVAGTANPAAREASSEARGRPAVHQNVPVLTGCSWWAAIATHTAPMSKSSSGSDAAAGVSPV